jgi:hypothetical protein
VQRPFSRLTISDRDQALIHSKNDSSWRIEFRVYINEFVWNYSGSKCACHEFREPPR